MPAAYARTCPTMRHRMTATQIGCILGSKPYRYLEGCTLGLVQKSTSSSGIGAVASY